MKIVPALDQDLLIIDLSGDFRIADSKTFEKFYHLPRRHDGTTARSGYGWTGAVSNPVSSGKPHIKFIF